MKPHMLTVAALLMAAGIAHAQDYPNKPIRLVLGYSPSGAADVIARSLTHARRAHRGEAAHRDQLGIV